MASPTQTVVGKGISISLIAEGLLKSLRDLIPPSPPKFLTNSHLWNGMTTKACDSFSSEIITDQTCQVNIISLAYLKIHLEGGVNRCMANLMTNDAELKTNCNTLSVTKECSRIPGEGLCTIFSKFL